MRRVALVLPGALLVGLLGGAGPGGPPEAAALQQSATSSREARADTVRARVLERVRPRPDPGEAVPDTIPDLPEGVREPPPAVASTARPGTRRQPRRAELPAEADSVMRALSELPGYRVSVYQAKEAEFQARDRIMVLRGDEEERARFSGEGVRLEADSSITYDDRRGRVWTTGPTLFQPPEGDRVLSRNLIYDLEQERGSAMGAQTTYDQGGRWIVHGDLPSVREGEVFGRDTRFTSCELDPPHSHFRAAEMKVVQDRVLVARSVRMFVEDVPVMWLPFIAQSLEPDRGSGLLTPRFSINDVVRTSGGQQRRISNIGYYWAMSPYSDLMAALDWFSGNYTAATGSMRYRWARQFLDGNVDFRHFWRSEGGRELTLSTRHNWVASERTRVRANARYVSSTRFVTRNTFDPRELNQTIDSDAGLTHRFDWGQLSVGANRRQFMGEDRTDMTLPTVSLSLSTLTLFDAPPQRASWYNNMSLSGSSSFSRDLQQRPFQPDPEFSFARTSQVRTRGSVRGSLGLGRLSLSGSMNLDDRSFEDVPERFFPDRRLDLSRELLEEPPDSPETRGELGEAQVGWSTSLSFQQNLIGTTTFTPSVSLDGRFMRVDSIPVAQDFVAGPTRVSVGAGLKTDLYGFYPGFANFEAIRHKVTPTLRWSYSPEVTPTELQQRVFGARDARVRNTLTFGFNQTWEARVREPDEADAPGERPEAERPPDPEEAPPEPEDPADPEERGVADIVRLMDREAEEEVGEEEEEEVVPDRRDDEDGPRRRPQPRTITLLAVQTNAITYDLVERDETGRFLDGFRTTTLSNSLRSDLVQNLSLSFQHDLFEERPPEDGGRRFAPHLSQLSLSFSLDRNAGPVRAVARLLGREADPDRERDRDPDELDEEDVGQEMPGFDTDRMVPDRQREGGLDGLRPGAGRGWNARISYSLRRPRDGAPGARAQMIQGSMSFQPTENWDARWSTSYDIEAGQFNDHVVSLHRDLHEWEATFSFRQTATGNWSFQFEISLRANRDLSFDFEQRSLEGRGPGPGPGPGAF